MIIFKTIRYKNLLATGNKFIEIKLNKHKSTLVTGSNGSGKTSSLVALFYALYGKALTGINKPQLINSITKKNLLVEAEFSIGNKEYLVRRGMKPNVFEIFCDGYLLNQDSQIKDYQEVLETQILKINHKSFKQIVIITMANYTPFMKLPAAERRNVIEDLLDIQIFSVMNSLLRDKIVANKDHIKDTEYNIKLIKNKIELHKKHIAELNQNNSAIIEQRKLQIEEHNEQIRQYSLEIKTIQEEIDSFRENSEKFVKLQEDINSSTELLRKAKVYEKQLQSQIQFYESSDNCPTCDQPFDQTFKQSKLESKNKDLEKLVSNLPKIVEKLTKLNKDMEEQISINNKISKLQKNIDKNNIKINTSNQFINSLKKDINDLETKVKAVKLDNSTLKNFKEEYEDAEMNKKDLLEAKELLQLAGQLLKDGGIKSKIIQQYVPIMNKLINSYLAKMDFFVQFELDETFKETIKSRFRDEFSYENFSQGEKLRIDLALLFAWRAIAKMRNSVSTNLLFFDEILDSSLDQQGMEEFLNIIKSLSGDTNLFIISHRSENLNEKFDHQIVFEKCQNFSRIAN